MAPQEFAAADKVLEAAGATWSNSLTQAEDSGSGGNEAWWSESTRTTEEDSRRDEAWAAWWTNGKEQLQEDTAEAAEQRKTAEEEGRGSQHKEWVTRWVNWADEETWYMDCSGDVVMIPEESSLSDGVTDEDLCSGKVHNMIMHLVESQTVH